MRGQDKRGAWYGGGAIMQNQKGDRRQGKERAMEKFWRRKVKWIMEMDSNMLKSL